LNFEKGKNTEAPTFAYEEERIAHEKAIEAKQRKTRTLVHLGFSCLFVILILILNVVSSSAVISLIFKIAGYTYGPLLGLFMFGLFTDLKIRDRYALHVCLAAPVLTFIVENASKTWAGFDMGFLTILINGLLTTFGLWIISYREKSF